VETDGSTVPLDAGRRWCPASGSVTLGRIHHDDAAGQHQHRKGEAVDHEHALHAGEAEHIRGVEQTPEPRTRKLYPDGGAEAKAGDGKPCDHALPVGEPAHADGDRDDVTKPDASAADDADEEELYPEGGTEKPPQQVAGAKRQAAQDRQEPGTQPRLPPPGQYHHQSEGGEPRRKDPRCLAGGEAVAARRVGQLRREHRPGVDRTER